MLLLLLLLLLYYSYDAGFFLQPAWCDARPVTRNALPHHSQTTLPSFSASAITCSRLRFLARGFAAAAADGGVAVAAPAAPAAAAAAPTVPSTAPPPPLPPPPPPPVAASSRACCARSGAGVFPVPENRSSDAECAMRYLIRSTRAISSYLPPESPFAFLNLAHSFATFLVFAGWSAQKSLYASFHFCGSATLVSAHVSDHACSAYSSATLGCEHRHRHATDGATTTQGRLVSENK